MFFQLCSAQVRTVGVSEGDWFDGFKFDLVFRNETSSLAVKSMDALADTYYTNP